VHKPTAFIVMVDPSGPADVQMLGVVVVKVTTRPDDAVALAIGEPDPNSLSAIGGKSIV
jgi:hypothetical protein